MQKEKDFTIRQQLSSTKKLTNTFEEYTLIKSVTPSIIFSTAT